MKKKNNIVLLKLSNNTNIFNLNVINVVLNNSTISKNLKIKEDMTLSNIYKFIINSIQSESIYSIEFKVKTNNQIDIVVPELNKVSKRINKNIYDRYDS